MAGHITKRKKNGAIKWRARYPDPSYGGKKEIERIFPTRREAERWLRNQQVSLDRGSHIDPSNTERRFSHIVDAWRATWIDLEPKTKAGYESILNKHVLPRWQDARIGAVSAEAIQTWINELAAARSPKTVRNVYGVLRSALNISVERHYIAVNPCEAVRLPKRAKAKEMLFLSAAEVQAVAEAITPHYRVLVYTAAFTGLRAGELGALRRRDIDLLHGTMHVHGALKDISTSSENIAPEDKGLIFGDTKTGKARTLGLPSFLVTMLTEHLESVDGGPDALVFLSLNGTPLRHDNFYKRHFKPAVRAALPAEKHGLRFHDLRHTCAALLIAADAHPKAIQDHLGHRDIQTTFNVYGHLLPQAQKALAAALDTAYEGSANPSDDIPRIGRV
jgi:integrase